MIGWFRDYRARTHVSLQQAYWDTFDTPAGKRVLADLEAICGIYDSDGGGSGPIEDIAWKSGKRAVYTRLFKVLRTDPETFARMDNEKDDDDD